MALPDGALSAFSVATRISPLSPNGSVAVGAGCYVTDALVKLTWAPQVTTGVDLEQINANGDIYGHFKHGDMIKFYTCTLMMASPDPIFEQLLCGGSLLGSAAVALAAPTAVATAGTAGTLATGTYSYIVTAYNAWGETLGSTAATASVTGPTGSASLNITAVTGAVGYVVYGRTAGSQQKIGSTTLSGAAAFIDTGAVTPYGAIPTGNTTAGNVAQGYQSATLGTVGNPFGVSIECWSKAITFGAIDNFYPYTRWVFPAARNFRPDVRDIGDTWVNSQYMGQIFENTNWGTGPFSDWPFNSTKAWQREREGFAVLPTVGLTTVAATN